MAIFSFSISYYNIAYGSFDYYSREVVIKVILKWKSNTYTLKQLKLKAVSSKKKAIQAFLQMTEREGGRDEEGRM